VGSLGVCPPRKSKPQWVWGCGWVVGGKERGGGPAGGGWSGEGGGGGGWKILVHEEASVSQSIYGTL